MSDETIEPGAASAEPRRGPGRPRRVVEAAGPQAELLPFRVERDFWPEEDKRVRAGTIVHMTAVEALDGIASGALSRA